MSPTLLLDKSSIVRPSSRAKADGDARVLHSGPRHEDVRTGIQYRCECARADGKHERWCILNLL